ncbi:MAG: LysM peptidoglycan-binding domain-containing protein [Kiritimatiellia bacterium]
MRARIQMRIKGIVCLCVLSAVMVGCTESPVGRRDARERNNRLVVSAYEQIEAGAFAEAALLLREALDEYPTLVRPHLDLAILLHERQQDYVRAIYHYRRYLELRTATEKDVLIQKRIDQARDSLVALYMAEHPPAVVSAAVPAVVVAPETFADADTVEAWERRLVAAKLQVEEAQRAAAALRREQDVLRLSFAEQEQELAQKETRIQQLEAQVRVLSDQLEREGGRTAGPALEEAKPLVTPPEPRRALEPAVVPRTYVVRPNDSLSVIAERVYDDANKWQVIRDANIEVLGDSEMVRIGQVLVIPEMPERDRR